MEKGELSIRLSASLKADFEMLCQKENCKITDGILPFITFCVENKDMPFKRTEIARKESVNEGKVEKLHIRLPDKEMLVVFKDLCDEICISYSIAIKTYIRMCLKAHKLLYRHHK